MKRNTTKILIIIVCLLTAMPTVAQHVSHRSTAHYNKRVDQFEAEGGIDSTSIVMLGNSLTENGKDWAQRIGTTKPIVNRGIIGDNTTGMSERLCQITPHHPRAIFLMAGINDMAGGTSSTEVASRVISLIEQIRQQSPETVLFVESILPINESNGRWKTLTDRTDDIPYANMLIRAYCQSNDIMYVDIFSRMTRGRSNELRIDLTSDGLHLTEQGYKIWAFELKKYVKRL